MSNKCITISGGFDSGCLPFIIENIDDYDFIFFNYHQLYFENELLKAKHLAQYFKKELIIIHIDNMYTDFERRNFLFLAELKKKEYKIVVMGNRNIFPFFDKYKDSNYVWLKILAYLLNIKLKLPITGWTKQRVINFLVQKGYKDFYNCYANLNDIQNCSCPNCKERKKLNF